MATEEPIPSKPNQESSILKKGVTITLEELLQYLQNVADISKLIEKLKLDGLKSNPELSDVCSLWIEQHDPTKGDVEKVLNELGVEPPDLLKSVMTEMNSQKTTQSNLMDTTTGQLTPQSSVDSSQTMSTQSASISNRTMSTQSSVGSNRSYQTMTSQSSVESNQNLSMEQTNDLQSSRISYNEQYSDHQYYGIGDITKPIGVPARDRELKEDFSSSHERISYNYRSVGDLIKDQNVKVKVRPMLVSFGGLPESGQSVALDEFLNHHVERSPYKPLTKKSIRPVAVGITQYELIADGSDPNVNFTLSEAMKESSFTFGVLSAFKNILASTGRIPVLDHARDGSRYFKDDDLNSFFMHMYQYLCKQSTIPSNSIDSTDPNVTALGLKHSLPDCLTLVNIWDHSIKNSARHLLSALQGHLYNHHMFLFLDLERDLNKLDEPLEIGNKDKEGTVFMKWRPRLHYLLRSAWATEGKGKKRRRVCTLFAKSEQDFSSNVKNDISRLEDHIEPVAKRIGVYKLLDRDIEVVNLHTDQKHMYRKIQQIASYTPPEEIPLSWLFLRSSFYHYNKIVISKEELKQKATKCGIDDKSLTEFCKFYTSFGSIIDLSLANPQYQFVIIKPVKFLKLLNELLYPSSEELKQKYPVIKFGIVPEGYCEDVLGFNEWSPFMDALVSLELATRTGALLELPPDYFIDRREMHYYISLCCEGEPITEVDPQSVYLITNIDTPHFFKQVTMTEELLKSMKDSKLHPCTNINQLIIKASDTMITMSFHSPVIKIQLSDPPNSDVCSHVVKAFHVIAKRALEANGVKVKYKFVKLCMAEKNEDIPVAQSILSSRYHVLPHSGSCKHCTAAGRNDELLKVWNEALGKDPVPIEFKPTRDIESQELSHIMDKMSSYSIQPEVFAETFIPDYRSQPQFAHFKEDKLMREVLFSWYEKIDQNRNGGSEPRRALAKKLSKLGKRVSKTHTEPQKIKLLFEGLAKRIDAYWNVQTDYNYDENFESKQQDGGPDRLSLVYQMKGESHYMNEECMQEVTTLRNKLLEKEKLHQLQLDIKDSKIQENEEIIQKKNSIIVQLTLSNKQLTKGYNSKLAVVLRPVEDQWYQLGECLEVKESLLKEIKDKGEKGALECLLQTWFEEGDASLIQLEEGLKMIGKKDLLPSIQELNIPFSAFVRKKLSVDQGVQFDYLIPLMDRLDSLSDVHVAGKKLFQIQGDAPQLIDWKPYGLRIGVSEGSYSHSETTDAASFALVGGHFKFPKNTKLVSGVYAFSTSKPLLQPLRLEIQHCVNLTREDQVKRLKFAIAHINTDSLPYQFFIVEGGQFKIGDWYGSIERDKFCLVSIVSEMNIEEDDSEEEHGDSEDSEDDGGPGSNKGKQRSSGKGETLEQKSQEEEEPSTESNTVSDSKPLASDDRNITEPQARGEGGQSIHSKVEGMTYTGLVYYEKKSVEDIVTFAVVKRLDVLIEDIKGKKSFAEIGQEFAFCFKPGYDYIEFIMDHRPQKKSFNGWTIEPHKEPTRLYQYEIDKFGDLNDSLPATCLISVYGSSGAEPTLHYGVPVKGVVHPVTIFIHRSLRLAPSSSDQPSMPQSALENKTSMSRSTASAQIDPKIACKVLQDNYIVIKEQSSTLLSYLVDKMVQDEIISDHERRQINDKLRRDGIDERINELFDILKDTIKGDGATFTWFIKALKDHGSKRMRDLAKKIDIDYQITAAASSQDM